MKDEMDLPWDEEGIPAAAAGFEEHDECLLLRAKALARAEMLARMVSVNVEADEEFGLN